MASIKGGSFVDNLQRIYSSAQASERQGHGELRRLEPAYKQFHTVLNEVQQQEKLPPDARPSLAPVVPMLTNMSPEEAHGSFRLSPHLQLQLSNVEEPPAGVKTVTAPDAPPLPLQTRRSGEPPIPVPLLPSPLQTKPAVPRLLEGGREQVALHPEQAKLAAVITAAGKHHGVDTHLSLAVAKAESNFNPTAVSRDGFASKGIFQLLDSTGREMMQRIQVNAPYNPFDPGLNAHLGVGYLKRLHELFGTESNLGYNLRTIPVSDPKSLEKLAVAAFNAGEGRVAQAQHRARLHGLDPREYAAVERFLPKTTKAYVERVSLYRMQFAQAERGSEVA